VTVAHRGRCATRDPNRTAAGHANREPAALIPTAGITVLVIFRPRPHETSADGADPGGRGISIRAETTSWRSTGDHPVHRTLFVVDIENSTARADPVKARLRRVLYRLLDEALRRSGISPRDRDRPVDRGELVRPGTSAQDGGACRRGPPRRAGALRRGSRSGPPSARRTGAQAALRSASSSSVLPLGGGCGVRPRDRRSGRPVGAHHLPHVGEQHREHGPRLRGSDRRPAIAVPYL
jgi:hypothetical protein